MRNLLAILHLVILLGVVLVAPSAFAGPLTWQAISAANITNTGEVSTVRTIDGVLHVVWATKGSEVSKRSIYYAAFSNDGTTITSSQEILSGWTSLNNPAVLGRSDGSLVVYFSGIGPSPYTSGKLFSIESDTSRSNWTFSGTTLSTSNIVYASSEVSAATGLDGNEFASWSQVAGVFYQQIFGSQGIFPASSCCDYDSAIAVDGKSGDVVLSWYSNTSGAYGMYSATISPSQGSSNYILGSANKNQSAAIQPLNRMRMTGRPNGLPGVYVAYCQGYPTCAHVRVWEHNSKKFRSINKTKGAKDIAIAASDGKPLWLAWRVNSKIFVAQSNAATTKYSKKISFKAPKGISSSDIWNLVLGGGGNGFDLFINAGQSGTAQYYYLHASKKQFNKIYNKQKKK